MRSLGRAAGVGEIVSWSCAFPEDCGDSGVFYVFDGEARGLFFDLVSVVMAARHGTDDDRRPESVGAARCRDPGRIPI